MRSTIFSAAAKWTATACRSWMFRDVVIPLVVSRVALMLVAWLAMNLLNHVPGPKAWEIGRRGEITAVQGHVSPTHYSLINMWSRWDAGWYYSIAKSGYKFAPDQRSNTAFFPVYPMLIRA